MHTLHSLGKRVFDSAVAWALFLTVMRGVAFVLVMGFALRKLPPAELGLWYVMLQIAGLAGIVEFGFNPTIGRFASYFWAGSKSVPDLGLPLANSCGSGPNLAALVSLSQLAGGLYRKFGLAVAVVMSMGGIAWLLAGDIPLALAPHHGLAFLVLTIGTAVSMSGLFWMGMLYGIHRVLEHNQLLVAGLALQYVFWAAGLALGWGIAALALGQVVGALFPRLLAKASVGRRIRAEVDANPVPVLGWKTLWPMTWRSGLAILGSYMAIQSTTLVCSRVADLTTTASYGLCMQVGLMVSAVSMSWMVVKYPQISSLRAQHRTREALPMIHQRIVLCAATFSGGAIAIVASFQTCLDLLGSHTRSLPPLQFALLFAYLGAHLMVGLYAALMQTGNQVPHVYASLLSGLASLVLAAVLGKLYGVTGLLLGPFAVHGMYYYWWVPRTCWRQLRRESTAAAAASLPAIN